MAAALGIVMSASVSTAQKAPERIFLNAEIFTADETRPSAEAFAVSEGRILAIGSRADILARRKPATEIVDLAGRRVLPGLIDAHSHAIFGRLAALAPNLEDAEITKDELKRRVRS